MKIYKENDKSKAICDKCSKVVDTTFKYEIFKYKNILIEDVLQGFCDECGKSVSIPHQSTYKIKSYREEKCTKKREYRVPAHINDIILSIGSVNKLGNKTNSIFRVLSKYYINKLRPKRHKTALNRIKASISNDLSKGKAKGRISCTIDLTDYNLLMDRRKEIAVSEKDLMVGIVVNAKKDFLDNDNPQSKKELVEIAHHIL